MKRKILGAVLAAMMVMSIGAVSVSAEDPVDYTKDDYPVAEREITKGRNMITDGNYNVYMNKSWVMSNGIGVGCTGSTNVVHKSTGTAKYHYTNAYVYGDEAENFSRSSGRKWGTGNVSATTGNVGYGAMHHIRVFYGW